MFTHVFHNVCVLRGSKIHEQTKQCSYSKYVYMDAWIDGLWIDLL